jgi:AcrR family transcriptional regulator
MARGDARDGRGRRAGGADPGDRIARAAERLTEKLERQAASLDRHAAELAMKAEALEEASSRLGGSIDLWMRGLVAQRKPRFTHDDVRVAAMRIVDTEGFDALTMRRLAAELEAPTMTLYHYVRTKDELLSLIHDAVMGEVVVPPDQEIPTDWKQALSLIARRTRDAMLRHPWAQQIGGDGPSLAPNSIRHFDQSLQALAGLDQPFAVKLEILMLLDEYVFGYCSQLAEAAGFEDLPELPEYVAQLVADGSFPQVEALIDELGLDVLWRTTQAHLTDRERFERSLSRVLDGIERSLS